jgi:hypothetical protein
VLVIQVSKEFLSQGGIALWLSEHDVAAAETLWEAVDSSLRREFKTLELEAGRRALQIANSETPLLLMLLAATFPRTGSSGESSPVLLTVI